MVNKIIRYTQEYPFVCLGLSFIWIFLFQSLNIFWGFELLDSGFHLAAYDNIFDAPDSVSGNFSYYLTNVIGGMIMKYLPSIGVVGYRIVGAFFVDISLFLIFIFLRKEIPVIHILIGSVLVVLSNIQIPYSFNNGICSCFFYICALLLLYKGLANENVTFVFMSGVLVGINIFSRIPNVLGIGLVLITTFHYYIEIKKMKCDWKSSLFFLQGVTVGIAILVILIISLGHQQAFIDALNILFKEGASSSGSHSFGILIWVQIFFYLNAIVFAALLFAILYIDRLLIGSPWRILFVGLASFVLFYHVYLNMGYEPVWSICLVGCLLCMNINEKLSLLSSLAMFMLIIEIVGSNSGNNHGSLPALLAAPVASSVIINRKNIVYVVVLCLSFFMKVVNQGNFFDFGPLYTKQYGINVRECALIRTTSERAEAMNATLPALRKFVHPKDTLFVYDSAPMMNYLTHTRPAGGISWPALGAIKPLVGTPKILVQKSDGFTIATQSARCIPTGNHMIDTYMQEHEYQVVWENPYFILLFPQK